MLRNIFLASIGAFVFLSACTTTGTQTGARPTGFNSFNLQSAGRSYSVSTVDLNEERVQRFELRTGDCPRSTGDCNSDRERVEFAERSPGQRKNTDWWYTWSVYLPEGFPRTAPLDTKLGQFHQRGDSGPELLFQLTDSSYRIKMTDPRRFDSDPMRPLPDFRNTSIYPRSSMLGRWTKVVVNANWTNQSDGYIRIWVNGSSRFNYNGPTTNDPAGDIYFKYGIYRSSISRYGDNTLPTLVAFYKDIKRGRARADVE